MFFKFSKSCTCFLEQKHRCCITPLRKTVHVVWLITTVLWNVILLSIKFGVSRLTVTNVNNQHLVLKKLAMRGYLRHQQSWNKTSKTFIYSSYSTDCCYKFHIYINVWTLPGWILQNAFDFLWCCNACQSSKQNRDFLKYSLSVPFLTLIVIFQVINSKTQTTQTGSFFSFWPVFSVLTHSLPWSESLHQLCTFDHSAVLVL